MRTACFNQAHTFFFAKVTRNLKLSDSAKKAFERLGIHTVRDLLFYKPTNYLHKKIRPNLRQVSSGDYVVTDIVIREILWPTKKRSPMLVYCNNNVTLIFFNHKLITRYLKIDANYK